jgi:hypothetical protein
MDTSNLDDKKNEYFNLTRDQILAQKRMMAYGGMNFMGGMGAPMGGYGGMGGIGGMSGMGGMSSMGDIGGYGGMGGIVAISGMGAPPGGFIDSVVAPSMPTTNDGFVPSSIHTTNAHISEVSNKDETQNGDAKDDGQDDEE